MPPILLNIVVIIAAFLILFGVWGGVHLLARHRLGDRKLGCRGPTTDDWGNTVCCTTGEPCDEAKKAACATEKDGSSGC